MITLYSGVPGSGKSYKMVAELSRQKDKYYIVHNIDGLKPEVLGEYGIRFLEYCDKEKLEITEFFSKEFQIKFCAAVFEKYKRPVLVIIDEAHEWFSRTDKNLKMWLSYHRHIDQDIWLVAHRITNIPQVYRSFIEIEYRAKSGSFIGVPGYFIYNRILGGQRAGYVKEKKNQAIFALYQSQAITSSKKRKKPVFMLALAGFVLVGVILYFLLPQFILKSDASTTKETVSSKTPAGAPADRPGGEVKNLDSARIEIEAIYRFVGVMGEKVVLENRVTGEQMDIDKMPEQLKLIEYARLDSCLLYSKLTRSFHRFYNTGAFVPVDSARLRSDASIGTVAVKF